MRGWWLGAVLAVAFGAVQAQVGTWHNFTSMNDVRGVARTSDAIWAGTGGGIFAWTGGTTAITRVTNAEGLRQMDVTAVAVDADDNVWAGCGNGLLHVYSPSSGSWRYILDIEVSTQVNKRINRIVMQGDTALICSQFGLSVFHRGRFEFGDTYTKFGVLLANTRVGVASAALHAGRIWAAVRSGPTGNYIASADLSNPNLLPPESWSLLFIGSTSNTIRTLDVAGGRLYAGTNTGLYFLQDSLWFAVDSLQGKTILAAVPSPAGLLVATADPAVYTVTPENSVTVYGTPLPFTPTSIVVSATGQPVVGSSGGGLLSFDGTWTSFYPNGPNSNQFISVAVDPEGTVWGASGYNGNGKGFYRYNGRDWKSFTMANSGLPTNDYFRVSAVCNGSVWASSWGSGAVEIPRGADSVAGERIFGRNVGMVGLPPPDTNYIVVSSVACDPGGNSWMTVINAADGQILSIRMADGSWMRLPVKYGAVRLTSLTDNIPVDRSFAFDGSGNLWAVCRDRTFRGALSFANAGAITDSAAYYLTETNGLPSNEIRTLVTDRENDIWIGTDRGIAIILDPDRPTRPGAIAAYRPLNGLTINSIAVDALNQKWVATPEGVIVLSQDGTQQIASYTVENTGGKLIENDVKSIAIDFNSGTVYFGTANGLASLTTAGAAPKAAFDILRISPNPYRVPSDILLTVDGLVENSGIKIMAIDGRVVRTLTTPGGRIGFWDGRDDQGVTVASGIYVVVAYSEDGSKVATGKVAVVRR